MVSLVRACNWSESLRLLGQIFEDSVSSKREEEMELGSIDGSGGASVHLV